MSLRSLVVSTICAVVCLCATPVAQAQVAGSAPAASGAAIVASVGEFVVHERDLDAWWRTHDATTYSKASRDLYEGRRRALDALLGDFLLEREATSRRTTPQAVLDDELPPRTSSVTDDEIRQLYEASLPLPSGVTFDQVKPMIVAYLQKQHVDEARARFLDELRRTARVTVDLEPPRQVVSLLDSDPAIGPPSAAIEIVEFSDFQCPYCRQAEPALKQLRVKYADRLRFVWKDFPLTIHPEARGAAEAARCAGEQGRFWEYHDILLANQQALAPDDLKRHARSTGLDEAKFSACVERGAHRSEVAAGLEEGARQGVQATPTVFINGRPIVGAQTMDAYERIVLEELAR